MNQVDRIADRFMTQFAEHNPVIATFVGVSGTGGRMTDLSPEGFEASAEQDRRTLAELAAVIPGDEHERVAHAGMTERLSTAIAMADAGEPQRDINNIASWVQMVREVFDLMPVEGEQAQCDLRDRLAAVPLAYAQLRTTYERAASRGHIAARRQVLAAARQCAGWAQPGTGFYHELAAGVPAEGTMRTEVDAAARAAAEATAELGRWLETELAPRAPERDAFGRDRYALASRFFLGAAIDLDEAYEWGWAEVQLLRAQMRRVAGRIVPGGSVTDAVAALNADPARRITGRDNLRGWMQDYVDQIIAALHGTHFDIPEPVKTIRAMIAPTGQGSIYYTSPSEDWSRPGQMWWAVADGVDEFSTWQETSTIHHEGVPGHHLQMAQCVFLADRLNRYQRMMAFVSGHGEGWALYAERLMQELGYLDDPGNELGMLDLQLLRAARVVLDLGLHLELKIPADSGWHPGETWNTALAWEFLRGLVHEGEESLRYELDRYLGWAGQAPAYKLGERTWLQVRAEARARKGADFSLRDFHSQALALGPLGLDPLREALARI